MEFDTFKPSDECSICGNEYDETCGGVQGHFGVTPVTFCEWCYGSIYDMISQDVKEQIREDLDGGKPTVVNDNNSPITKIFSEIAIKIASEVTICAESDFSS